MKKKFIVIILIFIGVFFTGCSRTSFIKKNMLKNNALDYFSDKYDIKKKNIKVVKNDLYDEDEWCLTSCNENYLYIEYEDEEYIIEYHLKDDYFADNYQYEEIYNDTLEYLKNKFSYASEIEIDNLEADVLETSNKYDGDVESYFKNITKTVYDQSESGYVWVDVWIETHDSTSAKEIKEKYYDELINTLENLEVDYNIAISEESDDKQYSAFYYYHVSGNYLYYYDNVDNESGMNYRTIN